jgi:AcrR family transcriptional regulator
MSPRKYELGRRAQAMARTRARIIDAAMALYREQPVASTSMQEVARRAGVAPATVLNHFPTPDVLTEAVVARLMDTLRVPSPEIFDELDTVEDRLRALAAALAEFFERAEPWFHVHEREHGRVAAFTAGAAEFDRRVSALIRQALGGGADARTATVARVLFGPPVLRDLRVHGGMTTSDAAGLASQIVLAWLHTNSKGGRQG